MTIEIPVCTDNEIALRSVWKKARLATNGEPPAWGVGRNVTITVDDVTLHLSMHELKLAIEALERL